METELTREQFDKIMWGAKNFIECCGKQSAAVFDYLYGVEICLKTLGIRKEEYELILEKITAYEKNHAETIRKLERKTI